MTRLLVFAPNWLGDAVMALPAIEDVRRQMADAEITVAARKSIAPLYPLVPYVDRVVSVDAIERGRFDAALLLPNSFKTALLAWRAGIGERWGYRADWRGPLLTRRVRRPGGEIHQGAYFQRLTSELGFPSGPLEPHVRVTPAMIAAGEKALAAAGCPGTAAPLVAFAPGAAYGGAKRWPPERFAAVARALDDQGASVVIVGSKDDVATGVAIEQTPGGGKVFNLIGRTDLPTLAGVFARCRAVVSNDSGAMHFAAAIGVNIVAIFGSTNERQTSPLIGSVLGARGAGPASPTPSPQSRARVLTHPVFCRPCMLRECPIDHRCMRGITVEAVAAAVKEML